MTELLYQTDSYLKEFSATILSADSESRSVVLDRSAFYPGGGGQPCDFGTLDVAGIRYPVEKVKKQGDDVLHFLGGTEPLPTPNAASRCAGDLGLGTATPVDAHPYSAAHPVRHGLP